jgi:hypothetical protein
MMALLPARRLGEGYQWVGDGVGAAGARVRVVDVADGVVFGVADGVVFGVADGLWELGELAGVDVEAVLAGAPPDG